MVNTMVKDPIRREINRNSTYRKKQEGNKTKDRFETRSIPMRPSRAEIHGLKVTEYKRARERLPENRLAANDLAFSTDVLALVPERIIQ